MSSVIWTDRARDELRALNQATARRINRAVLRLAQTGQGDFIKLAGVDPPVWRLRVGDFRVLLERELDVVRILRVLHRKDAYR